VCGLLFALPGPAFPPIKTWKHGLERFQTKNLKSLTEWREVHMYNGKKKKDWKYLPGLAFSPLFTCNNWQNFNPFSASTQVSRKITRQGGLIQLDYCFQVNAHKHLPAKGLPAAVIQRGLKSNLSSCKEAHRFVVFS